MLLDGRIVMDSSADGENNSQATSLPEERFNIAILCTAFVYKAMNGLGTLATIWATVVLLGGFSTLVKQQDFWYVTIIAFVQSIGILGGYEDPAHQIFMRAPEALKKDRKAADRERRMSWWRRRRIQHQQQPEGTRRAIMRMSKQERLKRQDEEKRWKWSTYECRTFLGLAIYVILRLGQVAAVATCMALSLKRLKKQDYVDPQHLNQDDHRNIKRSLNIFYYLVVGQGIIFTCLLLNPLKFALRRKAQSKYKLFMPSGDSILFRYHNDNYLEFITGNVRATLNMDLVTFAKNLTVSNSVDDQLVGVRAMDRILRSVQYRSLALMRLRASLGGDDLEKMVNMLGFIRTIEEQDIRGHAARVVLKLTPDILVGSYSQILYLISSSLLKTVNKKVCNMDFDLVWFGLRILDKLTDNPQNCRQVNADDDILSKIIDLTNLCGHGSMSNTISDSWIEQEIIPLLQDEDDIPPQFVHKIDKEIIVGMSLNILSKLVAAPGDTGEKLRKETSKNFHFLTNTGMILEHVEATRVISCLAVDEDARQGIGILPEVIKKLKDCLLSKAPYINITKVAAKLLLLEYTTSDLLNQIQMFIQENHMLEDQSFSLPVTALIEGLDLDEYFPQFMQSVVQRLDLEDLLSAPRVNHSEEAAKALVLLTTRCEKNTVAFLQEVNQKQLENIVKVLSSDDREKEKRRMLAHLEGRNLPPNTLHIMKKIICAEDEEHTRSMHAKLLQNLRAYSGQNFNQYMEVIDEVLPKVFKEIIDGVSTLENPSTNEIHAHDDLWVTEGKVLDSFIGLAVQICRSLNVSDFTKALCDVNLTVDTFVTKLKKILELYKSPTTDFPSIRTCTLELLKWMVENDSSYREILLQCGVYEQLHEVKRTAKKLERFKLFHCGVGVPAEHDIPCISSLATELLEQLHRSPSFNKRYHCCGEHSSTITVLIT